MAPHRRSSSSPFLPQPLLIILIPIVFFVFVFFVVPPFLSHTSQILRPSAVKKSWDSFNVLLVLFAIICGVFARKNDDSSDSTEEQAPAVASSKENEESVMAQQWPFGFPEKKIYDPLRSTPGRGMGRLRRSSSSYPDLKQESLIENGDDGFQFRFFDDFDVNRYRSVSPDKIIPIDSFSLHSLPRVSPPRKSPTPPPPPPPPPVSVHKQSRTYQTIRRKEEGESLIREKSEKSATEITKIQTPTLPVTARRQSRTYHSIRGKDDVEPLIGEKSEKRAEITKIQIPPPPPPPLPPSPARVQWKAKDGKVERRKSNAKKEIAMVLASLYKQSKRKKKEKTQKSDDDVASSSSPEQPVYHTRPPPSPPPPPPPLPPPPSMFHSLFKKASRSKKVHSVTASPALMPAASFPARSLKGKSPIPPPPPPRPSRRKNSANDGRPPLPTKVRSFPDEETVNTGGQSPFIPIPPPPPPFKMPATRFVIRGDFARIQSTNSSRCNSPEREEVEPPLLKEDLQRANKSEDNKGNSVFCPSPDVNTKADNFIARLRDEWRLEKMNSVKEKTRSLPAPG